MLVSGAASNSAGVTAWLPVHVTRVAGGEVGRRRGAQTRSASIGSATETPVTVTFPALVTTRR